MIYPKEEFGSVYQIPFEDFYNKGYRAIIFDIDNTLVPHGAPADKRSKQLCENLKELGFQICFLSNNNKKRVEPFAESIGADYISNAGKPLKKSFLEAAHFFDVDKDKILFVGDQMFTDILGANRVGYYSILVGPVNRKESTFVVLKRIPERISLFFFHKSRKFVGKKPNRTGYDKNIPEEYR